MDDFVDDLNDDSMDDPFEDDNKFETPLIPQSNSLDGLQQSRHFTDSHGHQKSIVPDLKDAIKQDLDVSTETDSNLNVLAGENHSLGSSHFFGAVAPEQPLESAFSNLEAIHGDPSGDMQLWHQQTNPDTCAIVSQEFIIESFIDIDLNEDQLVDMAIEKGYYSPGGGTLPDDVGKIIEDFGIPVERTEGNTFDDLVEKLQNNQKIIVGLDSGEIWHNGEIEMLEDLLFMPQADHAVEVIGYNEDNQTIILNDPGHPDGQGFEVSLNDFEQAWEDSNNFMMFTKNPAPVA